MSYAPNNDSTVTVSQILVTEAGGLTGRVLCETLAGLGRTVRGAICWPKAFGRKRSSRRASR